MRSTKKNKIDETKGTKAVNRVKKTIEEEWGKYDRWSLKWMEYKEEDNFSGKSLADIAKRYNKKE